MTLSVYWSEVGVKDGSSPGFAYTWKGPATGEKTIRTSWNNRHLAQKQAQGYSYASTVAGARVLRRELPEFYNPQDLTLFCAAAKLVRGEKWQARNAWDRTTYAPLPGYPNNTYTKDGDGFPTDSSWKENIFKWAVLSLGFMQADFLIRDDAYIDALSGYEIYRHCSYRDDRMASFVTIPGGKVYYVTETATVGNKDARLVPFGVGVLEAKKTINIKWHQVALEAAPLQTIDSLIGKVNKLPFVPPLQSITYPAGTLLFLPPKIDRYVMPNGQFGLDIEFVLSYFPQGHNKILKVDGGENRRYLFVTPWATVPYEPVPGSMADGFFLFDERDFYQAFLCSNP